MAGRERWGSYGSMLRTRRGIENDAGAAVDELVVAAVSRVLYVLLRRGAGCRRRRLLAAFLRRRLLRPLASALLQRNSWPLGPDSLDFHLRTLAATHLKCEANPHAVQMQSNIKRLQERQDFSKSLSSSPRTGTGSISGLSVA
jgi:hypothetical protein